MPTIQINIGTLELGDRKLTDLSVIKDLLHSLSEKIESLEDRLDTQDEPLKDIINEVTHTKPDFNKDLDDIKRQLAEAELEEIVINKS